MSNILLTRFWSKGYIYHKNKKDKSKKILKKKNFFEKVFEKALFFSLNFNFICLYLIVKLTFIFKLKAKCHHPTKARHPSNFSHHFNTSIRPSMLGFLNNDTFHRQNSFF